MSALSHPLSSPSCFGLLLLAPSLAVFACAGSEAARRTSEPAPPADEGLVSEPCPKEDAREGEVVSSLALDEPLTTADDIPRVSLPPLTPKPVAAPPMDLSLRLPEVRTEDYRGAATLFRHVIEVSRARYVMEPGSALPADVSDSLLGPPATYPEQARTHAALVEGEDGLLVVEQEPGGAAEDLLVEAELAMRGGAHSDALDRYSKVNRMEPHLARVWLRRAEAELHLDDLDAAAVSLERGLSLSPIDPLGHALLAELRLRQGDRLAARRAASRALALYPGYPPVVPLIPAITGAPLRWSAFRPRVRIVARADGDILVQADSLKTDAWMAWALCQAATRFEPDRSLLPFDEASDGLVVRRELLCAFSLADAATGGLRRGSRGHEVDPYVSRVARIAEAGYLAEFTLYEIIAPRLPGVLLHSTPDQHARLISYIDRFVLPGSPDQGTTR